LEFWNRFTKSNLFIRIRNIIHRDLKPENILGKNESDKLYLIDFGISKEIDYLKSNKREKLSFIGTSRYASLAAHKGVE
jgi:serine/threonine protein kinase